MGGAEGAMFSCLTWSLRHIKCSLLCSSVMLCRAEVYLGKRPDCEACVRLCLTALPPLTTLVWSESSEPGGRSQKCAANNSFVFGEKAAWTSVTRPGLIT